MPTHNPSNKVYRYVVLDTPENNRKIPEQIGKVIETDMMVKGCNYYPLRDLVDEVFTFFDINMKNGPLGNQRAYFKAQEQWDLPDNIIKSLSQAWATFVPNQGSPLAHPHKRIHDTLWKVHGLRTESAL